MEQRQPRHGARHRLPMDTPHAARGWNAIILTGNDIKEAQRLNAHRRVED